MKTTFTKNEILNFPKIEDYQRLLEEMGNRNLEGLSYDEIEELYYDLNKIIPQISTTTDSEKFNDTNLYRARMASSISTEENISITQTYSYPPPSVISKNGRANIKNKSVFYCSNHHCTSILECNPSINDVGYLGLWKPITKKDLKLTLYLPENLDPYNDFSSIAKKASESHYNKYITSPLGMQMIALRNFIANKFVNELPPYNLTSFIANEAMYMDFNTDFLVYPSSKSNYYYNNFAFHPDSVDKNLRLHKVLKFRVTAVDQINLALSIGFINVGIVNSNYLRWEIPDEENIKDFKLLNATFNKK